MCVRKDVFIYKKNKNLRNYVVIVYFLKKSITFAIKIGLSLVFIVFKYFYYEE